MTEEMLLHAHSSPALLMPDYLAWWFTEFKTEWEAYKNCVTKWQDLRCTVMAANGHKKRFIHWASYLIAYEEWADTHTQPDACDKIEFDVDEYLDDDEIMEWAMTRSYKYPSAAQYVDFYWTGLQRRQYD